MRPRLLVISTLTALGVFGAAQWTAFAATNFTVGARSDMSSFIINGADDPDLTLTRGQTYTFNMTIFGHPFWITMAPGPASDAEANQFSSGVTNNGVSVAGSALMFTVPASAPDTLFYQCAFHDPMNGTLHIVAPASAPALAPTTWAVLAGLLLAAAGILAQARSRVNGPNGHAAMAAMRIHDQ